MEKNKKLLTDAEAANKVIREFLEPYVNSKEKMIEGFGGVKKTLINMLRELKEGHELDYSIAVSIVFIDMVSEKLKEDNLFKN